MFFFNPQNYYYNRFGDYLPVDPTFFFKPVYWEVPIHVHEYISFKHRATLSFVILPDYLK